ncbi:MAG TPA: cytochrome c-type biogenesis protein CcmH [Solirubrobacteraceae bacterium]|nr:cytochrome c-type biogenesis protein CcmH [Solirubrobacteraceae bacterium]
MRGPRAIPGVLAAICAVGALAAVAGLATAATPRASLPAIERRVMCVTCKIPLIVAESPQADRERVFIRGLISEGKTESQIERALVSQYGPTALGLPSAHGFDLAAYLVPLAALLILAAMLALLLPRWRRRARRGSDLPATPALSAAETARLDADLARFDR